MQSLRLAVSESCLIFRTSAEEVWSWLRVDGDPVNFDLVIAEDQTGGHW
jgi:hypothetical protein